MKRILAIAALLAAFLSTSVLLPVQAQQKRTVLTAQGNPYLVDFFALQSKRTDLRLNVARKGWDAAFSEWLSIEHADAYRSAVKTLAFRPANPGVQVAAQAKRVSGSCCIMASGCCSMCPACCAQKSCTKGCCNLAACATRPDCCQ